MARGPPNKVSLQVPEHLQGLDGKEVCPDPCPVSILTQDWRYYNDNNYLYPKRLYAHKGIEKHCFCTGQRK